MKFFLLLCAILLNQACRSTDKSTSILNVPSKGMPTIRLGFLTLDDLSTNMSIDQLNEEDLQNLLQSLNLATPTIALTNYPCLAHMAARPVTIHENALESFFQEDLSACIKNLRGPEAGKIISLIARIYRRQTCVDENVQRYTMLTLAQMEPALCLTAKQINVTTQIEWDVHYKTDDGIARAKLRAATFAGDENPYCVINKSADSWSYEACHFVVQVQNLEGAAAKTANVFPPYHLNLLCDSREVANAGDQFSFDSGTCKGTINQWRTDLALSKSTDLTWNFYDTSHAVRSVVVDPRRLRSVSLVGHLLAFLH